MDIREYDHIEIKVWTNKGKFKSIDIKEGDCTYGRAKEWLESIGL